VPGAGVPSQRDVRAQSSRFSLDGRNAYFDDRAIKLEVPLAPGSQQNLGQRGDDHHTSRVVESEQRRLLDTSREGRVALECISSESLCKQRAFSVLPMSEKRNQISDDLHKVLS